MATRLWLLILLLSLPGRAAAAGRNEEAAAFPSVQRAIRELRFEDAHAEIDQTLKRGRHSREELIALYALRGEMAALVAGPDAGEADFRRLLVLVPDHTLPPRSSPVFGQPFAQARRWVATHGHLRAELRPLTVVQPGTPAGLAVAILDDPFAMVAGARLFVRHGRDAAFEPVAGTSLRPQLPSMEAGASLDFYVELVDAADDVLLLLGNADAPIHVELAPAPTPLASPVPVRATALALRAAPPPTSRVSRTASWVLGGLGLASLGSAVGVDVAGRQQYDALARSCAPNCSERSIAALHGAESAAIGLYVTAGAALATGTVLLLVDQLRAMHRR